MSGEQKVTVDTFSTDGEEEEVKISAEMMASMAISRPHTQVRFAHNNKKSQYIILGLVKWAFFFQVLGISLS